MVILHNKIVHNKIVHNKIVHNKIVHNKIVHNKILYYKIGADLVNHKVGLLWLEVVGVQPDDRPARVLLLLEPIWWIRFDRNLQKNVTRIKYKLFSIHFIPMP
jgi:hypothetical protein